MGRCRYRQIQGFALIEVVIVVAVVAILASLAVPGIAGVLSRQQGRAAAEGARSLLQLGRSEAIKQNVRMFVTVEPTQPWCIALSSMQGCGCASACAAGAELLQKIEGGDFPGTSIASVGFAGTLCGPIECVRFEPQRGTAQGSNGTVVLQTDAGAQYKILVATLGRVRVCVAGGDPGTSWPQC